jgi:hypothetical protein
MTESEWRLCPEPQQMLAFLREGGMLSERKARLFSVASCRHVYHLFEDARVRLAVELGEQYADTSVSLEQLIAAYREADSARIRKPESRHLPAWWEWANIRLFTRKRDWTPHSDRFVVGQARVHAYTAVLYAAASDAVSPDGGAWEVPPDASYNATHAADRAASAAVWVGRAGLDKRAVVPCQLSGRCMSVEREVQGSLLRDIFGSPFRPRPVVAPCVLTWRDGLIVRIAEGVYEHRVLPSGHFDEGRVAVLADALEDAGCQDAEILGHLRGPGPHVRGCYIVDLILGNE